MPNGIESLPNEPLRRTLIDAVHLLESEGIAYSLIGGLAVSLRGQPRVTADVDMVIAADLDQALRLGRSLDATRFSPLFAGFEEVVQRAFILPLRHRETGVKVDLAIGLSGFELQAISRARPLDLAGSQVCVATLEDLVIMKVLAGRPQDDQDIRGLLVAQGAHLDWDYALHVARDLGQALGVDLVGRLTAFRDSER